MMQLLQTMMADREAERAERQANLAALQQIAQNNQGHGNHDHPGSKLKNFQNTNPPMFSKTEEPLDADDWLQTIENNLEVAGVEAAEKVLFATHYLSGPARAWWTSARAMNAGQMMTWEDFKLKFSKYHVPQGLIKKMRDEFRELKQGRMSVVEYRDRFLTLSRYAPDETDTNEKRKERFLNGLHDEMQTVLVNIPFADLEALVDSAIQMEGKLHQANENRKRRMMNQSGPHHTQKHRNNSSGGFTPRNNRPPAQIYRPHNSNNHGGPPKTGGNNNNNRNPNSHNNGNNTNTNTKDWTNAIPALEGQTSSEQPQSQAPTRRSSQTIAIDWSSPEPRHCTRSFVCLANVASNLAINLRRPTAPSDPLGTPPARRHLVGDDEAPRPKRTPDEAEELLAKISKNHDDWSTPEPTPTPILKKRGMIELNDEDMREAKKSLMEKGIKSEDVKNLPPIEDLWLLDDFLTLVRKAGLTAYMEDERKLLPQTDLFSVGRKPWSRSKEEVDEQLKIQGFHQQHDSEDAEPSYDYTVTYPVASSSTYLEPGRSSSYYGDTTSWGPWE
ncbi:hypothetical protein QYE76_053507 [Lolium multiflorum]|uniref:Retrotransposon gag domain-containing protein n=1 Tax=Lolium multiflorum TaxID=4521 RepID=A0AAD8WM14_LOLMU|nr:hypothetical protein QYE76_053507 [Lolium multiflorum]